MCTTCVCTGGGGGGGARRGDEQGRHHRFRQRFRVDQRNRSECPGRSSEQSWTPPPSMAYWFFCGSDSKSPYLQTWVTTSSRRSETRCCAFATAGFGCRLRSGGCHCSLLAGANDSRDHQRSSMPKLEYVPTNPHHQGKEKARSTCRPSGTGEHGRKVRPRSRSFRDNVWLMDLFTTRRTIAAQQAIVLADAIENDDGIVHRISDECEKRRNDGQRYSNFSNEKSPG